MAKEIIAVKCPHCSETKEIGYIERGDGVLEDMLMVYLLPHQKCPEGEQEEMLAWKSNYQSG